MKPTKYLSRKWSEVDRGLAEGLLVYEASLNSQGIPAWVAQDPERRWTIDEIVDESMAVLEEAQDGYGKKGTPKQPGLRLVVVEKPPKPKPDPSPLGE